MVNLDLHRRKVFWVEAALSYMLESTDLQHHRCVVEAGLRSEALRRRAARVCASGHALADTLVRERWRIRRVGRLPQPELLPHPRRIVRRLP